MSLGPGSRLGPYEIVARVGAGGMGEVYRATDTKLGRDVALKLLPAVFAADPERLARFEREAKVLASLNHPGVAHLYGFESGALGDGTPAHLLVMELVEGEDLAERLKRGPIPVEEAVAIARQVAEALEEAHEKGIVHRDLKPANVKVTPDGKVKVLDFGLAKAWSGDTAGVTSSAELSQSPTLAHTGTAAGLILGTAAYMSPEQARGRTVDKRADIWAFGVLLFELLTGKRLFEGETVSDTLAAVLRQEVDWGLLPAGTPQALRRLLARCLERDPKRRLRDIGEARILIDETLAGGASSGEPASRSTRGPWRAALFLSWAVALAAVGGMALVWTTRGGAREERPLRILQVDRGAGLDWPVISPDGRSVVYVRDGRLALARLDEGQSRDLDGTENAARPFWSDDSRSIGYFALTNPTQLRLLSLGDGQQRVIATGGPEAPVKPFAPSGAAACGDSVWFASYRVGLLRATAGRTAEVVAPIDRARGERWWAEPSCLPDGRVLAEVETDESYSLHVFADGRRSPLLESEEFMLNPRLAPPDHIVFQRSPVSANRGVWAVPVSRDLATTTGPPVLLFSGGQAPSVSRDGTLVLLTGLRAIERQLVWVDRAGRRLGTLGRPQPRFVNPAISPDGLQVAVADGFPRLKPTVWLHSGSSVRPWRAGQRADMPAWSPDGRWLAYVGEEGGLMVEPVDGRAPARKLAEPPVGNPVWTPDGRSIVYSRGERAQNSEVALVSLADPGEPRTLLTNGGYPAVSPDGRLLAYVAVAMDRSEVFVTTFPEPGQVWPVSAGGGRRPRWNPKGGELFFTGGPMVGDDPNSHRDLFVARVDSRNGVEVGPPVRLFDAAALGLDITARGARAYDVAPDGQRLIVATNGIEGTPTITLVDDLDALIRSRR